MQFCEAGESEQAPPGVLPVQYRVPKLKAQLHSTLVPGNMGVCQLRVCDSRKEGWVQSPGLWFCPHGGTVPHGDSAGRKAVHLMVAGKAKERDKGVRDLTPLFQGSP